MLTDPVMEQVEIGTGSVKSKYSKEEIVNSQEKEYASISTKKRMVGMFGSHRST